MARFEDFREIRWIKLGNRLAQVALSLLLALGLNYLAAIHFTRTDLTREHQHSLSPETLAHLEEIMRAAQTEPITLYVTLPRETDNKEVAEVLKDIDPLLREFEFAGRKDGKKFITLENVDIFQQRTKAQELRERYHVTDTLTVMVVARGDRYRQISVKDLYEQKDGVPTAFLGERVIASALLDVAEQQNQKIYFLQGHGEMKPDDVNPMDGASAARNALQQRNFTVEALTLADKVPEDAAMLVIAGPQATYLPKEVEALRRYLEDRQGRILALIDPRTDHGLSQLLYEWGIYSDDRLIMEMIQGGVSADNLTILTFADHPITRALADYQFSVQLGPTRPARRDEGAPLDERLVVRDLMLSSPHSWAELDFRDSSKTAAQSFDPARDIQGPIPVAALAERSAGSQIGISLRGGRMLLVGSSGLIANRTFSVPGNQWLFLNMVNWMLDKNSRLNVPPKAIRTFSLPLAKDDLRRVGLYFVLLPAFVALTGVIVFWIRRR